MILVTSQAHLSNFPMDNFPKTIYGMAITLVAALVIMVSEGALKSLCLRANLKRHPSENIRRQNGITMGMSSFHDKYKLWAMALSLWLTCLLTGALVAALSPQDFDGTYGTNPSKGPNIDRAPEIVPNSTRIYPNRILTSSTESCFGASGDDSLS